MAATRLLLLCILLTAFQAQSGELVLSQDLALDYAEPKLISHSSTTLIIKYDDWSLSHRVVDSTAIYPKINLSGIEEVYLHSIFLPAQRDSLPKWLQVLAEEQARQFGLPEGQVVEETVGNAMILGTYNQQNEEGYLYIFDRVAIHQMTIAGTEKQYKELIRNIRER